MTLLDALLLLLGYAIGSIPSGLLLVRFAKGEDIRTRGSGNIGAANVFREMGTLLGVSTLVLDVAKGTIPSAVALSLTKDLSLVPHATALATVLGNVFPAWLRWRGGRGAATAAGAFGILHPFVMGISAGLFAVVVAVTRRASAGTLVASVAFPVFSLALGGGKATGFACAAMLLILWAHRDNMSRLLHGTETRLDRVRGRAGEGEGPK